MSMLSRHQCPSCQHVHTGHPRGLCPRCTLYAWAIDALAIIAAFTCVAIIAIALYVIH
jgi:hypothetical protein